MSPCSIAGRLHLLQVALDVGHEQRAWPAPPRIPVAPAECLRALDMCRDPRRARLEIGCVAEHGRDVEPVAVERRLVRRPLERRAMRFPDVARPPGEAALLDVKPVDVGALRAPAASRVRQAALALHVVDDKMCRAARARALEVACHARGRAAFRRVEHDPLDRRQRPPARRAGGRVVVPCAQRSYRVSHRPARQPFHARIVKMRDGLRSRWRTETVRRRDRHGGAANTAPTRGRRPHPERKAKRARDRWARLTRPLQHAAKGRSPSGKRSGRGKTWARLGSNQRPLACEASALPLSYAPGRRQRTAVGYHLSARSR